MRLLFWNRKRQCCRSRKASEVTIAWKLVDLRRSNSLPAGDAGRVKVVVRLADLAADVAPDKAQFVYAASSTLTTSRFPNTSRASLDPRQFGGVPGIEHPPHLLFVATEFSSKLHVGDSGFCYREIEGRFCRHLRREGNQALASRHSRRIRNLPPVGNPPAIASSWQSAACQVLQACLHARTWLDLRMPARFPPSLEVSQVAHGGHFRTVGQTRHFSGSQCRTQLS